MPSSPNLKHAVISSPTPDSVILSVDEIDIGALKKCHEIQI